MICHGIGHQGPAVFCISFLVLFCMLQASLALAGSRTVFLGETFCSEAPRVCIRASVSYDYGKGRLHLNGRVKQTRQKGTLLVSLKARDNRDKPVGQTKLSVPIRGRSFDLLEVERKVSWRDRDLRWTLTDVSFRAR